MARARCLAARQGKSTDVLEAHPADNDICAYYAALSEQAKALAAP
jgi:hypothetical protein